MPTISMFFGILIRMFNDEHNPPHFHAIYSGKKAMFNFEGDIIEGTLPQKQVRLIQAWTEIHREELEANWELAINGEVPFKIKPLE